MNEVFTDVKPMVYKSRINVPYHWWAGKTASRFLTSLRDDKKILGTQCPECNKIYLPPRKACPSCFIENLNWVEISDEGVLQSYTVARRQLASIPKKVPVIYGLIKLEGADTGLLHFIAEIDPDEVKIGMRLKAKFAENRTATIGDIEYFKPIS